MYIYSFELFKFHKSQIWYIHVKLSPNPLYLSKNVYKKKKKANLHKKKTLPKEPKPTHIYYRKKYQIHHSTIHIFCIFHFLTYSSNYTTLIHLVLFAFRYYLLSWTDDDDDICDELTVMVVMCVFSADSYHHYSFRVFE